MAVRGRWRLCTLAAQALVPAPAVAQQTPAVVAGPLPEGPSPIASDRGGRRCPQVRADCAPRLGGVLDVRATCAPRRIVFSALLDARSTALEVGLRDGRTVRARVVRPPAVAGRRRSA